MSSITSPPTKIALASSTKISLNDRFTKLSKNKPQVETNQLKKISQAKGIGLASAKNRKLAVQLANRPNVQAALKIKKRSIKQRLGMRKNLNNNQNQVNRRINQINRRSAGGIDPSRLSGGKGLFRKTSNSNLAQRLSRNLSDSRLRRVNKNNSLNSSKNSAKRVKRISNGGNRGGMMRNRQRMNNKKLQNVGRSQVRGPRRNTNIKQNPKSKNILDKDLDQYMSKSKSHLDMDLDQYMAKSKTHLDADLDSYMAQANGSS